MEFSPDKYAKAARDVVEILDKLVGLPKKARDAYRELQLDGVIDKINERLYGRYLLINAVENFGHIKGRQEDFDAIILTTRDRAKYLQQFAKKVEPKLINVSPELAASLTIMTQQSIRLYKTISEIEDPDRMAEVAPQLARYLTAVADYLKQVNSKLKTIMA